jgi:LacI family transcriptional regulator
MSSVRVDDVAAARDMTNYLIGLGHRRIGFVRGAQNHIISRTRFEGYRLALREHDLELDPDLVVNGDLTFESGLGATEQLLALQRPPTAIFASNDDMAAAVVSVAHRRDIRVPDQLSVAGFDDSPISRKIWPTLTTVRQPIVDMTEIAVESLIEILGNPATKGPLTTFTTYADYSIVIRDSTNAPELR